MLRRRRGQFGLAATITVLLLGVLAAESARAGTYVMRNCNVPGYPHALIGPWVTFPKPGALSPVTVMDACATGGGVSFITDTGSVPSGGEAGISLSKPSGPRSQITFVKAVVWYAARLGGGPLLVVARDWAGGTRRQLLNTGPPGSENLMAELPLGPSTVSVDFYVWCDIVTDLPCAPVPTVPLLIRGIEVTLTEDVPPIVLQPAGTLLEGGPQSDVRTLMYAASDAQSGLAKVEVRLGDTVVARRDLTPRCHYSDLTVCPATHDETLQIDTRGVPNGFHRLALRVQDAAGNERVADVVEPIEVANAPATTASTFELAVKFKGSSRTTLTVPYGRRVSLRGVLTHESQPSAGAQIEVLKKLHRPGAREVSAGRAVSNADGSFSLALPTTRPSRTLRLMYRPVGGGEVLSRALKLRVRAALRVRASLRGRTVRFSGTVLSGPIPKRGKRVLMEGRSPGSAWTKFRTLRTDRKGRFLGTFRLRVRRPGVALKVRAVVPNETGYGYVTARSRAVTMRVR